MNTRRWIKTGMILMTISQVSFSQIEVPVQAGAWMRSAPMRTITADSIFAYMNGAGELYLGYRFDRLEVYEYTAPDAYDILVEIYYLASSEDAFGLLSLDWDGEPFELPLEGSGASSECVVPARGLYGAGLLRLWCGSIYARIMAYHETAASRAAVEEIGTLIARQTTVAPAPDLLKRLPECPMEGCCIPRQAVSFLRSYLVLNSLFYLSEENILHLDLHCAVLMARCSTGQGGSQPRILFIQYPDAFRAAVALESFVAHFLPEIKEGASSCQIEEGWCGFRRHDATLAIVFSAPGRKWVENLLNALHL